MGLHALPGLVGAQPGETKGRGAKLLPPPVRAQAGERSKSPRLDARRGGRGPNSLYLQARLRRGCAVAFGCPDARLGRLDLAVFGRGVRHEVLEQVPGDRGDLLDGLIEELGVGRRGLREAADLADILQRCGPDLVIAGGGLEVVEGADVSTHGPIVAPPAGDQWRKCRRAGAALGAPAAARAAAKPSARPHAGGWVVAGMPACDPRRGPARRGGESAEG